MRAAVSAHDARQVSVKRQLAYFWQRHVLRRRVMLAEGLPLGMRFRFHAADDVGRHLFKYRLYEPHLLDYLTTMPAPQPGALVFDVGANLGWYPVLLHRLWAGCAESMLLSPTRATAGCWRTTWCSTVSVTSG